MGLLGEATHQGTDNRCRRGEHQGTSAIDADGRRVLGHAQGTLWGRLLPRGHRAADVQRVVGAVEGLFLAGHFVSFGLLQLVCCDGINCPTNGTVCQVGRFSGLLRG
jgi:hypothetical protein